MSNAKPKNWFAVMRRYLDSEEWLSEPFTRAQAWVDIVGNAAYESGTVEKRGILIHVGRGQLAVSLRDLSARWGWPVARISRHLAQLKQRRRIEIEKNNVCTVITVLKYETYQNGNGSNGSKRNTDRDTDSNTNSNTESAPLRNIKKNKLNKLNKKLSPDGDSKNTPASHSEEDFLEFWNACPVKQGRKQARIEFSEALARLARESHPDGLALVRSQIRAYAESDQVAKGYRMSPAKWLAEERYHDDPTAWQDRDTIAGEEFINEQ